MFRIALALGSLAVAALVAGLASGLAAPEPGAGHRRWGPLAVALTVATHAATAWWLGRSAARLGAFAEAEGLPGWVGGQAGRNRAKAVVCQAGGLLSIALAGGTGWLGLEGWHRALSTLAVGFQPGAILGEALMVAAQARLAVEVRAWAARGRGWNGRVGPV